MPTWVCHGLFKRGRQVEIQGVNGSATWLHWGLGLCKKACFRYWSRGLFQLQLVWRQNPAREFLPAWKQMKTNDRYKIGIKIHFSATLGSFIKGQPMKLGKKPVSFWGSFVTTHNENETQQNTPGYKSSVFEQRTGWFYLYPGKLPSFQQWKVGSLLIPVSFKAFLSPYHLLKESTLLYSGSLLYV